MKEIKSVLVVEDQKWTTMAIKDGLADSFGELSIQAKVEFVTSFAEAEQAIKEKDSIDLILLDHRMPHTPQGTLEDDDFDAFCETLGNIGYSLIPLIRERQPDAVIIGTSSMSSELRNYPHKPDESIDKSKIHSPEQELSPLLRKLVTEG